MKKLFALLSTFVLSLAIVGLATPTAKAADSDKWTEDPTLEADEIPMYEMGSIYTTFPNYYDNAAKADPNWAGASRMYPWNETRLRVAEYDKNGEATGKYYAIFFSGLTSNVDSAGNPASGAGNNINGYALKDGQPTIVRVNPNTFGTEKEVFNYNAVPADPSLSHLRMNFSGQDISIDMITVSETIGDGGNKQNLYNRMFVFDGEGRIIRGVAMDGFYVKPGAEGAAADLWAPMFCYVDGKVVQYVEGVTTPDKVLKQDTNEDGSPKVDESGQPVMVPTDEDNFLYKRFMWEWFQEKPTNVNTATYMAEGWDCDLWDYVIDSPDGNGYMAIAFLNGEGSNHKINDNEKAVTNATRKAASQEEITAAEYYRACVREIRIPKNGGTFDFGYLDKGVVTEAAKFNNIVRGAFLNGRTVKSAEARTYDFSTTGLKTIERVAGGHSYQFMDQEELIIEVMKGQSFKPAYNILYDGLASMWKEKNNLLSYSKDLNTLAFMMNVNGSTVVNKPRYQSMEEMVADFNADYRAFAKDYCGMEEEAANAFDAAKGNLTNLSWNFIGQNAPADGKKNFYTYYNGKWDWLVEYIYSYALSMKGSKHDAYAGASWAGQFESPLKCASPYNYMLLFNAFFTGGRCFEEGTETVDGKEYKFGNTLWIERPAENKTKFADYTIDTSSDPVNTRYVVKFTAENTVTGVSSSLTVTYVVVDEYTPTIEVNEDALYVTPEVVDGKMVINPINPMTLVKAYDGRYTDAAGIKGTEITQNVHFASATLNFANPTEGTHKVTATVVNNAKHYAETTFTVEIADVTAPYVEFYTELVLPYGTTWDPKLAVKAAVDNVDGNLFNSTITWCVDESSTKVKTTKPGKYNVKVSVYDAAGNVTEMPKAIQVVVLEQNATTANVKEITDLLETIQALVKANHDEVLDELGKLSKLDEITALVGTLATSEQVKDAAEAVAKLPSNASIEEVKAAIASVKTVADQTQTQVTELASNKGCGKKSAMFFEFLAAGCLLVFLLRKKH